MHHSCFFLTLGLVVLGAIPFSAAEEVRVTVTTEDCAHISRHVARDDVTYQAGRDVSGRPVVPADLDGPQVQFPETVIIDLSLPLADLFEGGNPPVRALRNADVELGRIDYHMQTGRITFNGQVLADPALNAIAAECRKRYDLLEK
ncbi:hypothetical protein [Sneathiella chinensis]|uniref:Uncharacterized protein n=1 Tax=Sneathiella chinensis TaxID=349750 RepID=A0ABQ5U4U7_9PROT|nr:hypothetical protein [Sneathiella chinensis]GLQ07185.1 hypothetical protein GCM10007924_24060 [Sneathiella chinensis]